MATRKLNELKPVFSSERITEWQPVALGPRYRYERDRSAVGREITPGSEQYEWYVLAKNDLNSAKSKVFTLINEDYL